MENNATCRDHPTMVSKPYYRVDLFNRQMTDVLLTSLLVTTIENKTVAHIGTSTGRLLQVLSLVCKFDDIFCQPLFSIYLHLNIVYDPPLMNVVSMLAAYINKIESNYLCQLLFGREPEGVIDCCSLLS